VRSCARISCVRLYFPNPGRFWSVSGFQKESTVLLLARELVTLSQYRVYCYQLTLYSSGEPWRGRRLVALPSSHQLGLENFTISPTTQPVKFRPIKAANGKYALRGEGGSVDPIGFPYLAALKSTTGTRTTSMAIVYAQKPTLLSDTFKIETCLEGYDCVVDQWIFEKAGANMVHYDFRFTGYHGNWQPFKDVGKEGWHVYWKGNTGLNHQIQLDLAPIDGNEDCAATSCSH
jgi:hypothetical protein